MNVDRAKGHVFSVIPDQQSIAISTTQSGKRSLDARWLMVLATLPIWLVGMPVRAMETHGTSTPQMTAVENGTFFLSTSVSARGEDDDKCIWLGVCN
jgi:hypothetical protein